MLKWRIITAAILGPLFLIAIWMLPAPWLAVVFALIVLLGGWEWARMSGWGDAACVGYVGLLAVLLALGWWYFAAGAPMLPVFLLTAAFWLLAMTLLGRYARALSVPLAGWRAAAIGYSLLWPAWLALVYLHAAADGAFWITFLLLLVWGADIGAYFSGRAFGRRKLAPAISPNKTWEGVLGGVALAVIAGCLFYLALTPVGPPLLLLAPLALITVAISVIGDLFESMAKRLYGVKDSGTILPGHGGVLDRIDSITAAAPVFALGFLLWQLSA